LTPCDAADTLDRARINPAISGFVTPLRYPGGKGRLGPWLAELMTHNRIAGGWYVEPYAGGAGAALFLLTHGFVEHVVINDADPLIHAFWHVATAHTDALVAMIESRPVTMETRVAQEAVASNPNGHSLVELAYAAFFLNRTSRSGILTGGVIGGRSQAGPYRLDARYNAERLVARIKKVGSLASQITVLGLDALDLLTDAGPGLPRNTLVYLDPPYCVKGSQLYRNHYQPEDHAAIAEHVLAATYPVVVTYDDCPRSRSLYRGLPHTRFSLHYSTHLSRPKATEVLFYRGVNLPSPPKMSRSLAVHAARQRERPGSTRSALAG
jgi:DNA adenine methylase